MVIMTTSDLQNKTYRPTYLKTKTIKSVILLLIPECVIFLISILQGVLGKTGSVYWIAELE